MDFSKEFLNTDFQHKNFLSFQGNSNRKIIISNLLDKDKPFFTLNSKEQSFKITPYGLLLYTYPATLPSVITINSTNSLPVAFIRFNILENKLKGTNTDNIPDPSNGYDYVTFKLYHLTDNTFSAPFSTTTLVSNIPSISFSSTINDTYFIKDCILEVNCSLEALNKVNISNFENSSRTHTISTTKEYFKITKIGLVSFNPISTLEDTLIRIAYGDPLTIRFNPNSKKIIAASNDQVIAVSQESTLIFSYKLYDKNGTFKKEDSISVSNPNGGKASALTGSLNDTPFDYDDILEIYSLYRKDSSNIRVTLFIDNIPFNSNSYNPFNYKENIKISSLGLILNPDCPLANIPILKNIITLTEGSFTPVLSIYFDINSKLLVSSSGFVTRDSFTFILNDKLGNEKAVARKVASSNADDFADSLNNYTSFEFGDTVILDCSTPDLVIISNYPNYNENYILKSTNESFTIKEIGLLST